MKFPRKKLFYIYQYKKSFELVLINTVLTPYYPFEKINCDIKNGYKYCFLNYFYF